jgi:hypothetical protein
MEVEERKKCLLLLQLVIDGQANLQQTQELENHLKACDWCKKELAIGMLIKQNIQSKFKRILVPSDVATSIQSKVLEIV